jgi:hypothetical protein
VHQVDKKLTTTTVVKVGPMVFKTRAGAEDENHHGLQQQLAAGCP